MATPTGSCSPSTVDLQEEFVEELSELIALFRVEAGDELVFDLDVADHRLAAELLSFISETDQAASSVVGVRFALDQSSALEPVDRQGHSSRRHHAVAGKFRRRECEWRPHTAKRRENPVVAGMQSEAPERLVECGIEQARQAGDTTGHLLRRHVQRRKLSFPLLYQPIDRVRFSLLVQSILSPNLSHVILRERYLWGDQRGKEPGGRIMRLASGDAARYADDECRLYAVSDLIGDALVPA